MSKQQKKFQKKKEREREVQAKLLRRWEAKKGEEKKQKEWEEKVEKETNPHNRKRRPFVKGAVVEDVDLSEDALKQAEIRAKLEHNLQILRALEQEYNTEQKNKGDLNAKLEAKGAMDLKSKMDMMQEMAMNYAQESLTTAKLGEPVSEENPIEEVPLNVETDLVAPEEMCCQNKFEGKFQEVLEKCCHGRIYPTEVLYKCEEASKGLENLLNEQSKGQVHEAKAKCVPKKRTPKKPDA